VVTILVEMIGSWRIPKDSESATRVQPPAIEMVSTPMPEQLSPEPFEQEAIKKILEIEALFQAQQQVSSIQVKVPDFVFPANEIKGKQSANALVVWNRIKDRYQYAEKINELSAKFGRIQPLLVELTSLSEQYPYSASVKRHLAYFYHLLGDHQKSLVLYKEAASISNSDLDWYNLAAKALTNGEDALACYSFGRFFQMIPDIETSHAWYVYIGLIRKFSDYQTMRVKVGVRSTLLTEVI
jgi:tetratricopeptide (TPR) repeat protein